MVDPEYIRSLIRATPFRRFTLVADDGSRIEIKRPSSIAIAPDGRSLQLADSDPPLTALRTASVKEVLVDVPLSDEATKKVELIRALRNATPFIPFAIITDDGRKLVVDKSYRVGIAPTGREICFASSPVEFDRIAPNHVKEVLRDLR